MAPQFGLRGQPWDPLFDPWAQPGDPLSDPWAQPGDPLSDPWSGPWARLRPRTSDFGAGGSASGQPRGPPRDQPRGQAFSPWGRGRTRGRPGGRLMCWPGPSGRLGDRPEGRPWIGHSPPGGGGGVGCLGVVFFGGRTNPGLPADICESFGRHLQVTAGSHMGDSWESFGRHQGIIWTMSGTILLYLPSPFFLSPPVSK